MACVLSSRLRCVVTLALCVASIRAFVAPSLSSQKNHPQRSGGRRESAPVETADVEAGLHGSSFCFLPLDQLDSDAAWPRLLRVAGFYPGVTATELAATPAASPAAELGKWCYEFPDAHGAEFGLVAVPGSDLLQFARDPVVVVAQADALGLSLSDAQTEVLVVVDRGATAFSDRAFFAFADPAGGLVIRRFDGGAPPPGWSVLGKLVFVNLPFDPKTQARSGTWLEENDVNM
eukprot:CAMPEP_0198657810 /NCGR_PEP_ID=MMETSP1467-20131203/20015_1 /TAXON_ID=1462469 /ORGANISM="unid. sp., Strain CCMP2135" /LENGTH=232 /DNA_ID=CAMNT_0044394035 /DNA_START=4 /DNA_END=702 /DNA_ORIENTATION=+